MHTVIGCVLILGFGQRPLFDLFDPMSYILSMQQYTRNIPTTNNSANATASNTNKSSSTGFSLFGSASSTTTSTTKTGNNTPNTNTMSVELTKRYEKFLISANKQYILHKLFFNMLSNKIHKMPEKLTISVSGPSKISGSGHQEKVSGHGVLLYKPPKEV